MILEFFLTLVLISFIIVLIGLKMETVIGIIGGAFLFILGAVIIASPIEIHNYDTTTYYYSYLNSTTGVVNSTNVSSVPGYTQLSNIIPGNGELVNTFFGIFISMLGVVVMLVFAANQRRKNKDGS